MPHRRCQYRCQCQFWGQFWGQYRCQFWGQHSGNRWRDRPPNHRGPGMSNDFRPDLHSEKEPYLHSPAGTRQPLSPDLLERWVPVAEEVYRRGMTGALPFPLTSYAPPGRQFLGSDPFGIDRQGVNFTSGDHLNLSGHPRVIAAAAAALDQFGPYGAGTLDRTGRSATAMALEAEIAAFAGFAQASLFPSGWNAGFAVVRTLVRQGDHVVAAAGLQGGSAEGMGASGARIHRLRGTGPETAARHIADLRSGDANAGILLLVESLSGRDSSSTDLAMLQQLCHRYCATLLVDVTSDFGATGASGRGALDLQQMAGSVDVVVGDLSRVFAANGGFVASNHLALCCALRHGPATCAMAPLPPQQVAAAAEALAIVASGEGALRRARLMANIVHLRDALTRAGLPPLGVAGPMVPVAAGSALTAPRLTVALQKSGAFALLAEPPNLAAGQSLWQFQVRTDHTPDDIDCLIRALRDLSPRPDFPTTRFDRP